MIEDSKVAGELAQYEALISRYGGYVYAIISRIAGRYAVHEDIEECVADVLVALWRARDRFDPEKGDYRHYVAAIARNKAITLRQRVSHAVCFLPLDEDILELDAPDPPTDFELNERRALVNDAVQSLEPPDPEIFVRRYYWGEAFKDIAQALGLTERAVEGRLYRGRKQLKAFLEGRLDR